MRLILFVLLLSIKMFAQNEVAVRQKSFANKFGEKNKFEYKIKFADGSWSIFEKEYDYDVPFPSVNIIADKFLIFANSLEASLELVNSDGISLKKIYLSEKKIEYERSLFVSIFKNTLAVALCEPTNNFHHIFLFDSELNLISESKNEGLINRIFYVNQSLFLSILKFNNDQFQKFIRITDLNFNTQLLLPGNFHYNDFSDISNYVLLYDNKLSILFDLNSMKVVSQFNSDKFIVTAKLFADKIAIIECDRMEYEDMRWKYYNPTIRELSSINGQEKIFKLKVESFNEYKWINEREILLNKLIYFLK